MTSTSPRPLQVLGWRPWLATTVTTLVLTATTILAVGCVPRFPAPRVEVAGTDEQVARGQYLATHVTICITCHSVRDWSFYGGPTTPGTEGLGGPTHPDFFRLPADVVLPSPNITQEGVGSWTDGELIRAISGGLRADGAALFPAHPYFQLRRMPREDLEAIVAYLRTLEPGSVALPTRDLVYALARDIGNTLPLPPQPKKAVPKPGSVESGAYLAEVGNCKWCHTPTDTMGWPILGQEFQGGAGFLVPAPGGGRVFSSNLTPHPTGLGSWTREVFIARFKNATPEAIRSSTVQEGAFNSPMNWAAYSGMTEQDLGAIYDYLSTLRPRNNPVTPWVPGEGGSALLSD
ncbi:MAG TPA: cytochrome C [Deltaproteobacteria bacterium]|nr:cytochrome C [Deltaproteobacteria bacterium]HCP47158.1 cytochrome C [Deltaproteobacteria bacterium]